MEAILQLALTFLKQQSSLVIFHFFPGFLECIIEVHIQTNNNNTKGFSPRYAAPEIFARKLFENNFSVAACQKLDIYAFGIVLWEIMCRKVPWESLNGPEIRAAVLLVSFLFFPFDSIPFFSFPFHVSLNI